MGLKYRNKSDPKAERAQDAFTQELVTEYLGDDKSRVLGAENRAVIEVWLSWLTAALSLDKSVVLLCCLPKPGRRLLLMGRTGEAQTTYSHFAVRDGEPLRDFFAVPAEIFAHLYVIPTSRLVAHYSGAREKLSKKALATKSGTFANLCFGSLWIRAARR